MLRLLLRLARIRGDIRAAASGPAALAKRAGRRAAHRAVGKLLR